MFICRDYHLNIWCEFRLGDFLFVVNFFCVFFSLFSLTPRLVLPLTAHRPHASWCLFRLVQLINHAFNKFMLQSGRVKRIRFYRYVGHMLKHCVCLSGPFMTVRNLCSSNQWIHSTAPLSKHHHFKAQPPVLCFITSDTPTKRYLSAKCNVLNLQFILKTARSLQYLHSRIKLVCTLNKVEVPRLSVYNIDTLSPYGDVCWTNKTAFS